MSRSHMTNARPNFDMYVVYICFVTFVDYIKPYVSNCIRTFTIVISIFDESTKQLKKSKNYIRDNNPDGYNIARKDMRSAIQTSVENVFDFLTSY